MIFPNFERNPVALTFGKGQALSFRIEGLPYVYLLTKFDNSALNSVSSTGPNIIFFQILRNPVTLTFSQGDPMW